MKRFLLYVLGLMIAPSGSAISAQTWQATTLSSATIEKTRVATQAYHACLDKEINAFRQTPMDSRDATSIILKKCEFELTPIRTALLAEQVPPKIADRLLRKRRNQAVRKVLQLMMFAESQREAAAIKKPVP